MAEFTVHVDGVPIPVRGVESKEQAHKEVAEAVKANPNLIEEQRERFARHNAGGAVNRFLIGAGRTVQQTLNAGESVLEAVGLNEETEAEVRAEQAEAEAFDALDRQAVAAEDIGQFLANPLNVVLAGAGARMGFNLARKGLGLAGKRARAYADMLKKTDATVKEVVETASSQGGKNVHRALAETAERASVDDAAQAASTLVKQQRQRLREAQIRIRRDMRAQEQAAQARAQAQAQAQAEQQAAQQAQQARNMFSRIEQQGVRRKEQATLRDLIRQQQTGRGPR